MRGSVPRLRETGGLADTVDSSGNPLQVQGSVLLVLFGGSAPGNGERRGSNARRGAFVRRRTGPRESGVTLKSSKAQERPGRETGWRGGWWSKSPKPARTAWAAPKRVRQGLRRTSGWTLLAGSGRSDGGRHRLDALEGSETSGEEPGCGPRRCCRGLESGRAEGLER